MIFAKFTFIFQKNYEKNVKSTEFVILTIAFFFDMTIISIGSWHSGNLSAKVEEKTKSGIFIPDTASKEKPMQGTVLAVGNGAIVDGKRIPIDLKVGDSIVFAKYCGTQVKYNGEELLILAERDILAVVEPDKKKK